MLWRHEGGSSGPTWGASAPRGGGTLQELLRSGWATEGSRHCCNNALFRFSFNFATILQHLINTDILRILSQRTSARPRRASIHTTTKPTIANSNVSKTKSLMSPILYAAPLTSNVIHWDAHHLCLEERSSILFGAVRLRAVRTVTFTVRSL